MTRLVGQLWRWHRRVGVLAAVFVLVLVVTGIVLNHTSELGLDHSYVDSPWLSRVYGDDSGNLPAFQLDGGWVFRSANGHVYLNALEVAPCDGVLIGALQSGDMLYAACTQELLLITSSGELIESVNASTGLPVPLQAIGFSDSDIALQSDGIWWLADLDRLDFSQRAPAGGTVIHQLVRDQLPASIYDQIPAPDQWLSWERLLLDLHSGRLFGRAGVLVVDTVGVLLLTLATSGTAMWWLHRRRGKRLKREAGDK